MAKHIYKHMPAEFKEKVRQDVEKLEREEMPELIAKGQRLFARRERLHETLQALKSERLAQGVSLSEMEQRTGISKTSLSRLENDPNPNPTVDTLSRIAEALGREMFIELAPAA